MKKLILTAILAFIPVITGCSDFVGLDEISIVAGIAIDRSALDPNRLKLTFEIVDASAKGDSQGQKTYIVESEGITIQEAIGNANKFQSREMYFGNAELLVLQQSVAQDIGVDPIFESFLRNLNMRDTLQIIISLEQTAAEILAHTEDFDGIVSYLVTRSLDGQKNTANSTNAIQIYQMYNDLRHKHKCLALPMFRAALDGEGEPIIDGLGIFHRDKLIGKMSNDEMEYFMFLTETLKGGSYAFNMDGDPQKSVTISIIHSSPKLKTVYNGETFDLSAKIDVTAGILSVSPSIGNVGQIMLEEISYQASAALANDISKLVTRIQTEHPCDIFGFGTELYVSKPEIWRQFEDDWISIFSQTPVDINVNITLENTGMIYDY